MDIKTVLTTKMRELVSVERSNVGRTDSSVKRVHRTSVFILCPGVNTN